MPEISTIDHRIDHVSRTHSLAGEPVKLFVRERRMSPAAGGGGRQPVVLFVHGGTYPSAVDFDLDVQDYSWMRYLAERGFHVFATDCVGYGGSSRLWLDHVEYALPEQQELIRSPRNPDAPAYPADRGGFLRTPQAEWQDIEAVVGFIRDRTGAERINLIGWSGGGPRAGGYTALHPDQVDKLILLAPAYERNAPDAALDAPPETGHSLRITTRELFDTAWDREVKRAGQFDPVIREKAWAMNMALDPVGAGWTPPVVRSPGMSWASLTRGWNSKMAGNIIAPTLLISMEWDAHVLPKVVRDLYEDISGPDKVLAEVRGASHYLPWESDHRILHGLSADWLERNAVAGVSHGVLAIDPL
jgi:pimeloyl-ACP methyl ester carboxylesterase